MIENIMSNRKVTQTAATLIFSLAVCFVFINGYDLYTILITKVDNTKIGLAFKTVSRYLDALAAAIFITLWWNRTKNEPLKKHVYLFLSLAWLVWAIPITQPSAELKYLLSQINNLFLLWALWDFSHGGVLEFENHLNKLGITHKNYLKVVGVSIACITAIEIASIGYVGEIIDIIVSSVVVVWLCFATSLAFIRRFTGYSGRALAFITILIMFAAVLSQIFSNEKLELSKEFGILLSTFYQTGITLIISGLTVSWAFFQMQEKEKMAVYMAKKREEDMVHIVRNILKNLELDFKKGGSQDHLRIGTARLLFEHIHMNKPTAIFEFLNGANLKEYLNSVLTNLKIAFNWSELEINIDEIPIDFAVWETSAQKLARIITEAGINAFKYAGGKKAYIRVKKEDDWIIVEVEDTGPGFEATKVPSKKGEQLGYEIIDIYLKDLKGTRKISSLKTGTLVVFKIQTGKFLKNEDSAT